MKIFEFHPTHLTKAFYDRSEDFVQIWAYLVKKNFSESQKTLFSKVKNQSCPILTVCTILETAET